RPAAAARDRRAPDVPCRRQPTADRRRSRPPACARPARCRSRELTGPCRDDDHELSTTPMTQHRYRRFFLFFLVVAVSIAFVLLLRSFLVTILLAAVFSGLVYPLYSRIALALNGRRHVASALTLLIVLILVVAPLGAIFGVVLNQAVRVTNSITPVVERFINEPTYLDQQLGRLPGIEYLEPYRDTIVTRAGDVVNAIGGFLIG